LIVHRGVNEEMGQYASILIYQENEAVAVESLANQSVAVCALLP
jgi:hypothetical protein